jgi:hypothetical protein
MELHRPAGGRHTADATQLDGGEAPGRFADGQRVRYAEELVERDARVAARVFESQDNPGRVTDELSKVAVRVVQL